MRFVLPERSVATLLCGVLLAASAFTARAADLDKPAPELDVRLLNGKLMRWKDLRGKVVVNMIWATWSPAARNELPDVQQVYDEYRARGLEVFALAIDERSNDVREFLRHKSYSFPIAMRSDAFFDHYGRASTTPMYYIVDRNGILRHRIAGTLGLQKMEALLKPLLAETPSVAGR